MVFFVPAIVVQSEWNFVSHSTIWPIGYTNPDEECRLSIDFVAKIRVAALLQTFSHWHPL
jgi:hypothetical protein